MNIDHWGPSGRERETQFDHWGPGGRVAVVIPAMNEADRIGATVAHARQIPGVDLVVVVDDGSTDLTALAAWSAGAAIVRHRRNQGKAAAMVTGSEAVRRHDDRDRVPPRHLLFLDADLGETAGAAGALLRPVADGEADMTIARFPADRPRPGGRGYVVRLARRGVVCATGWATSQPLSGQRCLTRAAFDRARPLAHGFGVETGLTIDVLRRGLRVVEVDVPLAHRATGADLRGTLHRAHQFVDVSRALAVRALPRTVTDRVRRMRGVPLPG
jgi:glycosyltransferase involved in cell wall biosynthesis